MNHQHQKDRSIELIGYQVDEDKELCKSDVIPEEKIISLQLNDDRDESLVSQTPSENIERSNKYIEVYQHDDHNQQQQNQKQNYNIESFGKINSTLSVYCNCLKEKINNFFFFFEEKKTKYPRLLKWIKILSTIMYNALILVYILLCNYFFLKLEFTFTLNIRNYYTQTAIPGTILGVLFILSGFNIIIPRKYFLIILLDIILVGYVFDAYKIQYRRHGLSLQQIFLSSFVIASLFTLFLVFLFKIIIKYRRKGVFIDLLILVALLLYIKFIIIDTSCDYFTKGIRTNILDQAPYCKLAQPKICWYQIFNGAQDYSKFIDCKAHERTDLNQLKNTYQLYLGELFPFYGIPDISKIPKNERYFHELQLATLRETKGYFTIEEAWQKGFDVVLNTQTFELITNVKRNESLAKSRAAIQSNGITKNVLLIFIDALGRPSFHLKMKKLAQYLKKKNERLFEFLRFHPTVNYTGENYRQFFFGEYDSLLWYQEQKDKKLQSIVKYYKDNGFITGHSQNDCHIMSYWFYKEYADFENEEPYDHDGTGFSCDPYLEQRDSDGVTHDNLIGANSIIRRCIYGKDTFEHVLEYGKQFWQQYDQDKKFLMLEFMDAHEGSGEVVTYLDEPLTQFLESINLEETTLILLSDHGWHMRSLFYLLNVDQVRIEANLPILFFVLPNSIMKNNTDLVQNMENNLQSLMDPLTLYSTFRVLAGNYKQYLLEMSLFNELPKNKTCYDVIRNKTEQYHCSCFPR